MFGDILRSFGNTWCLDNVAGYNTVLLFVTLHVFRADAQYIIASKIATLSRESNARLMDTWEHETDLSS